MSESETVPEVLTEVDGNVLINDFEGAEPSPGQMRQLRITEAHDYDLIGTLLGGSETEPAVPRRPVLQTPALIKISPSQLPAR